MSVIQVSHNVDLLLVNTKLGQIMRTMEINIWLLETLFILIIVKFLQDKKKYRKRRAKISADISARLFRVSK